MYRLAMKVTVEIPDETAKLLGLTEENAARTLSPWLPDLDVNLLLVVLAGALGVLDPDADPYPGAPTAVARHATVLIASLLSPDDQLQKMVGAAIGEIERAQTIEIP